MGGAVDGRFALLARRAAIALLAGTVASAALAACGVSTSPSQPSLVPSVMPSPTASASAPASASPSATGEAVPWDADLLLALPAEVRGLPLTPEPDAFGESASDPSLVRDVEAGAVAFVIDPSTEDYAVSFVYHLRDGVFDDAWYRDWRDSFDEGVCEQAGGVTGHAEAELGGRSTYIGSCAGGVLTYHAHLETAGADLVVSTQSLGDVRLGEQVMSDLRS